MPIELSAARSDLQSRLNDASNSFYTVSDLNTWLNEGCRDMARRSKSLYDYQSQAVYSQQQQYPAPTNFVELHRCEFAPTGQVDVYPLEFRNYSEMDSIWGIRQNITQYTPNWWTIWKTPPNTFIKLFPSPSVGGTLRVFYYRTANQAINDTDYLDVYEGWWDLAIIYAQYLALFKTADPRWSQMKQEYMDKLQDLMAVSSMTDNTGNFSYPMPAWPSWPFGGGMDGIY
jgi:hypothetical protein